MKKKPVNEDSDEFDADEPEEFEESGSDWDPEEDEPKTKKRKNTRKPTPKKGAAAAAAGTKKKKTENPPSDDEEEEEEVDEEEEEEEDGEDSESETEGSENGAFVVLKTDFQAGGNPPLWKIDGKALLQKFIPFEQDGKTLYKNTSTYSGWTQNNRNQYASAPVTFVVQGKKEVIIEFNRDKVVLEDKKEEEGETKVAAADT